MVMPCHAYDRIHTERKETDEMPYNALIQIFLADATSGFPSSRLQKGTER